VLLFEEPPGPARLRGFLGDGCFLTLVCYGFSSVPTGVGDRVTDDNTNTSRNENWQKHRNLFGDAAVHLLAAFSRVDQLDVRKTKISPDGIAQINRMCPKCRSFSEPRNPAWALS
jgi:hypothetical protein